MKWTELSLCTKEDDEKTVHNWVKSFTMMHELMQAERHLLDPHNGMYTCKLNLFLMQSWDVFTNKNYHILRIIQNSNTFECV